MSLSDVKNLSFVTERNGRIELNPRKALNGFIFDAALVVLKSNGYSFTQLFPGSPIFATK